MRALVVGKRIAVSLNEEIMNFRSRGEIVRVVVFGCLFIAAIVLPMSPGFGLLLGIGFSIMVGNPFPERSSVWAQRILGWSVVGLGAGIQIGVILKLGMQSAGLTILSVGLTLAIGIWIGRISSLSKEISVLLAAGTAICGASAIAALGAVMKPKREDLSAAMAAIFLLNAVALFIFPAIGQFLQFDQQQFGLWAALAIHDTSSVVGAGMEYGEEALEVATTVKLIRVLWILPLTIGVSLAFQKEDAAKERKLPIPFFVFGFLGVATFFTLFPGLSVVASGVKTGAYSLLTGAIFLVGTCLSKSALREIGFRPLLVSFGLWVIVAVVSAVALKFGWIGLG